MSEPMILRARLQAPVKEVRHALSDPEAMRVWLAEHAEADAERYVFWGRYTPEGDAPHQRLLHADERTLRFSWLLGGEETVTEITLEEEGPETAVLSLSQSHFDFQDAGAFGQLQTFWALTIANLVDHVEGREVGPKCDYTSPEMRVVTTIDAPVQEVYDSLIDSRKVSAWFGYPIEIEPHVGGRYAMGGFDADPNPARIIDLVPGRSATTDWGAGVGVTTWELEGSQGGTRLTFVQSGFDTAHPPYGAWSGWLSGLAELRRFHELADWRPIWIEDAAGQADGAHACV
ncbi:SRPBCC family protein [Sphaerisporangium sp. TRM90804]|uniref:SRPBCC family protein n=1 Tax=Sphaerisporangium sp. TRM90804 TaxID=3031113 RepID=UPI00244BD974|nr:SRPBCC family protein [Sphaerisporangium sp. TRM90804]MDH2426117.1 SRPBCC family protein [Sphaerisporangium sp. TRM90804]